MKRYVIIRKSRQYEVEEAVNEFLTKNPYFVPAGGCICSTESGPNAGFETYYSQTLFRPASVRVKKYRQAFADTISQVSHEG